MNFVAISDCVKMRPSVRTVIFQGITRGMKHFHFKSFQLFWKKEPVSQVCLFSEEEKKKKILGRYFQEKQEEMCVMFNRSCCESTKSFTH